MKRIGSGRPKSTRLHNEMDVREGKTTITYGLCKQLGHNRWSCKNDRCEVTHFYFFWGGGGGNCLGEL